MTSTPPPGVQQIYLIDFLCFVLTGDGGLGREFVSKYQAETSNKEVRRLCDFIRNATAKDLDADPDETWNLMALLAEGLDGEADPGIGRTAFRGYLSLLKRKGAKGREDLGMAATAMVAFHTLRSGAITLYQSEEAGQPPPIPWFKLRSYGFQLQRELGRSFPFHRELISCSYRAKLAEVYALKGLRRHAKTRLSRIIASIPEDLAITPRMRAEVHYNHATVCDDQQAAYDGYLTALFNSKKVRPSKETAYVEIKAFADMAQIHEKRGHLREAVDDHERALKAIEAYKDFWTPVQASGWILQRSWLAGEALCLIGKYDLAADRFENAASHADFLRSAREASRLAHIAMGAHLKMRADLLRAPVTQASEIRKRHLVEIERYIAQKAPETISLPRAGYVKWFNFKTLWRLLRNRREFATEVHQYASGYPFMLADYQQTCALRDMLRRQLEILESFGGPQARNYVGGLDVAPDTAFAFRFTMEALIRAIRSDESVINIDPKRYPEPQLMLLKAVVSNELSIKANSLQFELPANILEAIDFCEVHLPQELFHALKYFADFIANNPSHATGPALMVTRQILDRMESIAVNYAHPEDAYLVRMKLRGVYQEIAASLCSIIDHSSSSSTSLIADLLSVCAERAQSYYDAAIEPGSIFTPEEMKIPAVMEFVRQSEALADARNRHFFSDGVVTEFGAGSDHYSQRLGSPACPENSLERHDVTQSAVDRLRECQKGYAASLEEVRRAVRAFQPSRPYLRELGGTPGPGVLRLHILLAGKRVACVAFFADEVGTSLLSQAQSESLCSELHLLDSGGIVAVGNLIDSCLRNLQIKEIQVVELCFQPPLEAVPWAVLKDHVKLIPKSTPYRYDIGVGFTAATVTSGQQKGTKCVVVGPQAQNSDLAFGSLEFHTAWLQKDAERLALPVNGRELLVAAAEAKILHLTGHFRYNGNSLTDSSITSKRFDSEGITLGFLQAQRTLLPGGLVILNLCGSGRSGSPKFKDDITVRISNSPREANAQAGGPKALVSTFLCKGATCVVATLWEVDDLPSFLFSHKLRELLCNSVAVGDAVEQAGLWLKTVSCSEVLTIVDAAMEIAPDECTRDENLKAEIVETLREAADRGESPFSDPIHWSAYVTYGRGDL